MNKQIDDLMALVADNFQATEYDSYSKLRTALDAALKECHNVTLDLAKEVCRQVVCDTNSTLTWEGCNEIQEALEKEKT
jgi:hypothetical protein